MSSQTSAPLFVAVVMLSTSLAGCVLPDLLGGGQGDVTPDAITKQAVLTIDESTEDADELADVLKVSFEYTHQGAAAAASDVTATFIDDKGNRVSKALSSYTSAAQVQAGDVVKIPGANLTSGLRISQGETVLQERGLLDHEWFTVAGYPLPFLSREPGNALYEVSAGSDFSVKIRDAQMDDGQFVIEALDASWKMQADGTIDVETGASVGGPTIDFATDMEYGFEAQADMFYREDSERINAGGRMTVDAEMNMDVDLAFSRQGALERVSVRGRMYADGDIVAWDKDHPKSENWRPEDLEHPFVDEEFSETEEIEFDPEDVDAMIADFLGRLWNSKVGVGDEFTVHVSFEDDDFAFTFDMVTQVTSRDSRKVAAGTFDSLRVTQTTRFFTSGGNINDRNVELSRFTYWVGEENGLLLFAQGEFKRTFTRDDIEDVIDAFGRDLGAAVPEEFESVIGANMRIELMEYSSDLMFAPWFTVHGLGGPAAGVAGAALMFGIAGGTSDDYYAEQAEPMPHYNFDKSESADRLTVASASSAARWDRLELRTDASGVRFALNQEAGSGATPVSSSGGTPIASERSMMIAGDFLEFCQESPVPQAVSIEIVDAEAGWTAAVFQFQDIGLCT